MAASANPAPTRTIVAKITSKGQITVPVEVRRRLGAKAGDRLTFEITSDGVKVCHANEESRFEKFRGIGTGIPELDGATVDEVVRYFREMRGHDEVDDRIFGVER